MGWAKLSGGVSEYPAADKPRWTWYGLYNWLDCC
jgi:hypothetical protein